MKSILDDCYGFALDKLIFQNEGELSIYLTELLVLDSVSDIEIGNDAKIKNVSLVEITEVSKSYEIQFAEVVFYQVIDESITNWMIMK